MAFSWSSITKGDTKILADHANTLRANANTLITLMTANTGKCNSYSCSSLGTIPAAVTGATVVSGSWLDDIKASVDRIDTSKYCATAHAAKEITYNGTHNVGHLDTHNSGLWSTNHSTYNTGHLTPNNSSQCSSYYDGH